MSVWVVNGGLPFRAIGVVSVYSDVVWSDDLWLLDDRVESSCRCELALVELSFASGPSRSYTKELDDTIVGQ